MVRSILIIDDQTELLRSLRVGLETFGWEVIVTADPVEALQIIYSRDFTVVLIDYQLRETTGIDLSEKALKIKKLFVVLMTGIPDEDVVAYCRKMRIPLLVKPFHYLEFETAINPIFVEPGKT